MALSSCCWQASSSAMNSSRPTRPGSRSRYFCISSRCSPTPFCWCRCLIAMLGTIPFLVSGGVALASLLVLHGRAGVAWSRTVSTGATSRPGRNVGDLCRDQSVLLREDPSATAARAGRRGGLPLGQEGRARPIRSLQEPQPWTTYSGRAAGLSLDPGRKAISL